MNVKHTTMKNRIESKGIVLEILFSLLVIGVLFAFAENATAQNNQKECFGDGLIADIPKSDLNGEEKSGLILMREEEKLARDVYVTLGDKWGLPIFTNISRSEQVHSDAVKILLDRYDIEDPIKDNATGVFTSLHLAELYNTLVKQGSRSLMDALLVGATIEDLDIKDLNELTARTDNEDIIVTYKNLNKGSRNHMRAFSRQISNRGGSYTPQYISKEEYETFLNSPHERGAILK